MLFGLVVLLGHAPAVWSQGAVQVSTGATHSCAIDGQGQLWCWGQNDTGALGLGDTADRSFPNPVPGMESVVSVTSGSAMTCAITTEAELWCWGGNAFGQLGVGDQEDRLTPARVAIPTAVHAVEIANNFIPHVCALTQPGIWCWGSGFLGQGPSSQSTVPLLVAGTVSASGLAVGGSHTCIVTASGDLQCWGLNNNGQLGLGDTEIRTEPATVPGLAQVEQVVAGFRHSCARDMNGALWCWGRHSSGQLGLGGVGVSVRPDRLEPTEVTTLTLVNQITAGLNHTCAIRDTGELFCFGSNSEGQVGFGSPTLAIASPAAVDQIGATVSIAAGSQHSCGIDTEGGLWCWGSNAEGQLGLANVAETVTPMRLPTFPLETTQTTLLTFQPLGTYQLGQPVSFRAEVSAASGTPGGQVSFRNDGVEFATATLDASGRAEVTFAGSPLGQAMPITARYTGTALLAPSISDPRGLFVSSAETETVLSGPTSAAFGEPVNLVVGVTSPWLTPFGTVRVVRDNFILAEAELDSNGQASFQLINLPPGTNQLQARMVASQSFLRSRSNILSVTIGAAPDPIFRDRFEPLVLEEEKPQ